MKVIRNIVGRSNTGIFAGAFDFLATGGIKVFENRVFDSDFLGDTGFGGVGILVGDGENNIAGDNTITNSDNAGILVSGGDNTAKGNTINEATFGVLAAAGNRVSDNRFFNTTVVQGVFDPNAPLASSQRALRRDATNPTVMRRRLRKQ